MTIIAHRITQEDHDSGIGYLRLQAFCGKNHDMNNYFYPPSIKPPVFYPKCNNCFGERVEIKVDETISI